jgi:RNA polymerase sigma factor (sigma-70 family)
MADHHDHGPEWAHMLPVTPRDGETNIQTFWNLDIKRAALAAARGNHADAEDYAQQARLRVMMANRAMPDAPISYIRVVVSNTMKSARRPGAHRFSANSALAEQVDENLPAASSDDNEDRNTAVADWTGTLPASLLQIYRHLYVEERSQRETAGLMKMSQPRVAQLHRQLIERGRNELTHLAA